MDYKAFDLSFNTKYFIWDDFSYSLAFSLFHQKMPENFCFGHQSQGPKSHLILTYELHEQFKDSIRQ